MNPRIKELAEQAKTETNKHFEGPVFNWSDWYKHYNARFAELIVRECAGICDKRYVDIGQDGDGWLLARQIAEHFGVEE